MKLCVPKGWLGESDFSLLYYKQKRGEYVYFYYIQEGGGEETHCKSVFSASSFLCFTVKIEENQKKVKRSAAIVEFWNLFPFSSRLDCRRVVYTHLRVVVI